MKTLYYGGTILTMTGREHPEAVLTEDGKITAVGTKEALMPKEEACELYDLQGAVLMPGFIDPHSHFFQTALSLLQVSLDGVQSVAEISGRIQKFLSESKLPEGKWLIARDYDNNRMDGLKNPTLEELDALAPRNPMVIHHKSGHMGLMNSMALAAIGITPDTPVPEGGKIEAVDGKLTGYLEENAFFEAIKKVPMAEPAQLMKACAGAQKKYASYGITTVQDGMVVEAMLPLYEALMQQKLLDLDVVLYASTDAYEAAEAMLKRHPENNRLSLGGLKIFLDGSPQGRTAWMRTPYQGTPDYCGYGTMTDEAVTNAFRQAAKAHTQIICHCNGDGAAAQFLRCLKQAEGEYPELAELRPVLIHGQLMGRDQLPEAAALGAVVSFFVAHVYHWGDTHIRNFGLERASQISPAGSALKAGIPITFHQDTPVIAPDMLETIWCAVCRRTEAGVVLGADERITPEQALKAVTVNAARQYSREGRIGAIAPGLEADLVILDQNPLTVEPEQIRHIRVLRTLKGGREVYAAEA